MSGYLKWIGYIHGTPCRRLERAWTSGSRRAPGSDRYLHGTGSRRYAATAAEDLSKTRNIGIVAHIDAGKTTTTERMLYYSGFTQRIGNVDEGTTVTDFLPMERERGITIQSAAVTFHWPPVPTKGSPGEAKDQISMARPNASHTINLIDTPGHADFTFEVLRSLRVLDGVVCILDGVAGVEAQTEKVWRQASVYQIPSIIYVNKLDREGAAFGRTVKEIGERLMRYPAVCQIPWWEGIDGKFVGVGDIVHLKGFRWRSSGDGKAFEVHSLHDLEETNPFLAQETKKARAALVELLSEHDEQIIETFETHGDHMAIPAAEITKSLRRCLLQGNSKIVPVFAGASFKNIGVQPLLDAVVDLLPAPTERPDPEISLGPTKGGLNELISGTLQVESHGEAKKTKVAKKALAVQPWSSTQGIDGCALAFKVVNDARRGVLVYIRVYSGSITRNTLLYNTNLHLSERPTRLLTMYASQAIETQSIPAGQIGVVVGLKHARTGDTLVSYAGANAKTGPPAPINDLQLRPIEVPPPVFFASVEPRSLGEARHLDECLSLLLREDPSLQVSVDEDSAQTLLSGMGELHLEIARDRLVNDFKAKAGVGPIEIGYRECIKVPSDPQHYVYDREVAGKKGKAGCTATVAPLDIEAPEPSEIESTSMSYSTERDGNLITVVQKDPEPADPDSGDVAKREVAPLSSQTRDALVNGALAALSRSPRRAYTLRNTRVALTFSPTDDAFGSETTPSALTSAARLATQAALRAAVTAATSDASGKGTTLMEPVMNVSISLDEASLGAVVHDISSARGGTVLSLEANAEEGPSNPAGSDADAVPIPADKIYAPPDPFAGGGPSLSGGGVSATQNRPRTITARVPLKEMVGYLKHLRSLTGGRGSFVMSVDRFEKMSRQRERMIFG